MNDSKKYIGVKLVDGVSMTLGEFRRSRNQGCSLSENPDAEGYQVTYKDGYVSWCPKAMMESQNLAIAGTDNELVQEDIENFIKTFSVVTITSKNTPTLTTFVQAVLANGFVMTDSSACVDPVNYSEEIEASICLERIKNRVWELLGFLLASAVNGFEVVPEIVPPVEPPVAPPPMPEPTPAPELSAEDMARLDAEEAQMPVEDLNGDTYCPICRQGGGRTVLSPGQGCCGVCSLHGPLSEEDFDDDGAVESIGSIIEQAEQDSIVELMSREGGK